MPECLACLSCVESYLNILFIQMCSGKCWKHRYFQVSYLKPWFLLRFVLLLPTQGRPTTHMQAWSHVLCHLNLWWHYWLFLLLRHLLIHGVSNLLCVWDAYKGGAAGTSPDVVVGAAGGQKEAAACLVSWHHGLVEPLKQMGLQCAVVMSI